MNCVHRASVSIIFIFFYNRSSSVDHLFLQSTPSWPLASSVSRAHLTVSYVQSRNRAMLCRHEVMEAQCSFGDTMVPLEEYMGGERKGLRKKEGLVWRKNREINMKKMKM